jgi:hypothetical protein
LARSGLGLGLRLRLMLSLRLGNRDESMGVPCPPVWTAFCWWWSLVCTPMTLIPSFGPAGRLFRTWREWPWWWWVNGESIKGLSRFKLWKFCKYGLLRFTPNTLTGIWDASFSGQDLVYIVAKTKR